jgi:hypothetical protein
MNYNQNGWTQLLGCAQIAYNNAKHEAIGMSAFFATDTIHELIILRSQIPTMRALRTPVLWNFMNTSVKSIQSPPITCSELTTLKK